MMETEVGQFNTRIKPGDVIHVQADVMYSFYVVLTYIALSSNSNSSHF